MPSPMSVALITAMPLMATAQQTVNVSATAPSMAPLARTRVVTLVALGMVSVILSQALAPATLVLNFRTAILTCVH